MAWVCLCEGVDDNAVRGAIHGGARCIPSVGAACGAGINCHGCHATIDELLDEHLGLPDNVVALRQRAV